MTTILAIVAAYVLGSLPTGLVVVRALTGTDIRTVGSGNIGTVNVLRVAGLGPSALVLIVDMLKGFAAVWLARVLGLDASGTVAAGLAAIVGHNWSVFLRFQGGKGIATSFGVLLGIAPLVGVVAATVWGVVVGLTRLASLGSLVGMAAVPAVMWWQREPRPYIVFGIITLAFALYRHRTNLVRLISGRELKITDRPR